MKALILHGTDGNSESNWFPWLKHQLEDASWEVWVPDLPNAHEPNIKRYNEYIFANSDWVFDNDTVIVGHSSGAVAALGLLKKLPDEVKIDRVILIGSFNDNLGWSNLDGLFEIPFDFETIKRRVNKFIFIHSDDDPYCPLDHAEYLSEQLDGKLIILPGQKHFSVETDPKYKTFPLLKELLLGT